MFNNETSIFDEEEGTRQVIVALVIMIMFIISLNACYQTKCWTRPNTGPCIYS
jgi:hypothetical protein